MLPGPANVYRRRKNGRKQRRGVRALKRNVCGRGAIVLMRDKLRSTLAILPPSAQNQLERVRTERRTWLGMSLSGSTLFINLIRTIRQPIRILALLIEWYAAGIFIWDPTMLGRRGGFITPPNFRSRQRKSVAG